MQTFDIDTIDGCDIANGRDFYSVTDHFDWIVSNPPYGLGVVAGRFARDVVNAGQKP